MKRYPASALYPQADNKTSYVQSLGYTGKKPVYVLDGKVISHRSIDWFDFCAALRKKRHKLADTFSVVVWHRDCVNGSSQSILLHEPSYDEAIKKFNQYLKRPAHCRSFNSRNTVQIHGPKGLIHDLKH